LQALIELEASQVIGAGRYERSDTRTTHRNGSRRRLLSTKAGDVELAIPKLREGSFYPSLLEPRERFPQGVRGDWRDGCRRFSQPVTSTGRHGVDDADHRHVRCIGQRARGGCTR
jgi:hypothetical protein